MWCTPYGVRVHAAYLLRAAQLTLRAGIVRIDRELFHQIIVELVRWPCVKFASLILVYFLVIEYSVVFTTALWSHTTETYI